jgi:spore coat polysaccharide biosynthesis protein SpsF
VTSLCVVQARTGSTRLPGKVLADVAGRPMLRFMLDRLTGLTVDELVVATSALEQDDAVADVAAGAGVPVVRGPEQDVLARFALALEQHPANLLVRLTADCPLADPQLVGDAVALALATGADYVSNSLVRTYPDGLDVEVVTAAALREAMAEATDPVEREHVTPFVYRRTSRYRLAALCTDEELGAERWTVDTAADLDRIRAMVAALDDPVRAGWRAVLAVAGRNPPPGPGQTTIVPVPDQDASHRRWEAVRNGTVVARVGIHVVDGTGHLSYDGPPGERAVVIGLVEQALTADHQVTELRAESRA